MTRIRARLLLLSLATVCSIALVEVTVRMRFGVPVFTLRDMRTAGKK